MPGGERRSGCGATTGEEFTSRHFLARCKWEGIKVVHIQPGRPMQNDHLESFNGRLRYECLNANWSANLAGAKEKIEEWRKEYNAERPREQPDVSHEGGVCAAVLRAHQRDGRNVARMAACLMGLGPRR
ncbi:MAG: integrase core domain-containing protein [Acidobacteriota bacterium]